MGRTGAQRCPCGTATVYDQCCGRYHRGAPAPTAEALMRSRYTAYAMGDMRYLEHSWHPDTRPRHVRENLARRWIRLDVLHTEGGGLLDQEGTVEFDAHHLDDGDDEPQVLHERSRFVRLDGRWTYLDGEY
jgi:SEC-C motif-containing protein